MHKLGPYLFFIVQISTRIFRIFYGNNSNTIKYAWVCTRILYFDNQSMECVKANVFACEYISICMQCTFSFVSERACI